MSKGKLSPDSDLMNLDWMYKCYQGKWHNTGKMIKFKVPGKIFVACPCGVMLLRRNNERLV